MEAERDMGNHKIGFDTLSDEIVILTASLIIFLVLIATHPEYVSAASPPTCGLWQYESSDSSPSHPTLLGVKAISSSDVWTVGSYRWLNGYDRTLFEHRNDVGWTQVSDLSGSGNFEVIVGAVDGISSNDVWAVGLWSIYPLFEHWDGVNWSGPIVDLVYPNSQLISVATIAADDVWAAGYTSSAGLLYHFETNLQTVSTPEIDTQYEFRAVAASGSNDVWVAGDLLPDGYTPQPLIEHWDGLSWTVIPTQTLPLNGRVNALSAISPYDVWAVGVSGSDALILHWNGTDWSSVVPAYKPDAVSSLLTAIAAISPKNIWAVGFYISTNGSRYNLVEHWDGSSWKAYTTPNSGGTFNTLTGVTATSLGDVWAVGLMTTDYSPQILHYRMCPNLYFPIIFR